jgi:ubiquinone/menaquinone biosynthesis C-methylase UbiE
MTSPLVDTDPFSDIASNYDASFTELNSVVLLRRRIHELVRRSFPAHATVLDLACGTGEDALLLARQGYVVVGADRSRGMLDRAWAKSRSMDERPAFVHMDAVSLAMFRNSSFDAIISNFGGLNCVSDLRATLSECHRVLRPRGTMVLCLLGAHSIWENAAFALRGAWRSSFRRRSGIPVPVRVGQDTVDTWYHSIRSVRQSAGALFDVLAVIGLSTVAPPPSSQSFARRFPRLTSFLYQLDRSVQAFPIVRGLGDHTVFVLRRGMIP